MRYKLPSYLCTQTLYKKLRIEVISVHNRLPQWVDDVRVRYQKMFSPPWRLRFSNIHLSRFHGKDDKKAQKQDSHALLKARGTRPCIALDKEGSMFDSVAFSGWLTDVARRWHNVELCFLVGGPLGFDRDSLAQCQHILSLSPLTLPHALAQVVLVEQLFRAHTIVCNTGYHK